MAAILSLVRYHLDIIWESESGSETHTKYRKRNNKNLSRKHCLCVMYRGWVSRLNQSNVMWEIKSVQAHMKRLLSQWTDAAANLIIIYGFFGFNKTLIFMNRISCADNKSALNWSEDVNGWYVRRWLIAGHTSKYIINFSSAIQLIFCSTRL